MAITMEELKRKARAYDDALENVNIMAVMSGNMQIELDHIYNEDCLMM